MQFKNLLNSLDLFEHDEDDSDDKDIHAKTSLVCTKIEINFLTPAYSYIH